MSTEYFDICHDSLIRQLKERGISHAEVARRLKVSSKTLQRMVNRSAKRIRSETLNELAQILETCPKSLCKQTECITIKPRHPALENLLSLNYFRRVRGNDDWDTYISILSSFHDDALPTSQLIVLRRVLGVATLFASKLKSSKSHLDKSIVLATVLDDYEGLTLGYCWLAIREDLVGNQQLAKHNIEQAKKYMPMVNSIPIQSAYELHLGRLEFHAERFENAEQSIRKSIVLMHQTMQLDPVFTAIRYAHLGSLYLRQRNFLKAKKAFEMVRKYSELGGWVRGTALSNLALGIIMVFNEGKVVTGYFGQGKKVREYLDTQTIDKTLDQMEFIKCILFQEYEAAKKIALHRLKSTRSARYEFANAVLDAVFLSKLIPNQFSMRESLIKKAEETFLKNKLEKSLSILKMLSKTDQISLDEFLTQYSF